MSFEKIKCPNCQMCCRIPLTGGYIINDERVPVGKKHAWKSWECPVCHTKVLAKNAKRHLTNTILHKRNQVITENIPFDVSKGKVIAKKEVKLNPTLSKIVANARPTKEQAKVNKIAKEAKKLEKEAKKLEKQEKKNKKKEEEREEREEREVDKKRKFKINKSINFAESVIKEVEKKVSQRISQPLLIEEKKSPKLLIEDKKSPKLAIEN